VPLWKILWGGDHEPKSDSQSNLKRGSQQDPLFFSFPFSHFIKLFSSCSPAK
jgi:hypothetical protein